MEPQKAKRAKGLDSAVWLAAALLLILLLITWALLAAMLGAHAAPSDTIALTPSQSKNALYQTFYTPVQPQPGMQTQDSATQWQSSTDIDLFKAAYTNAAGQISVKSGTREKVLAPGTTNVYTFSIRNTGNTALDYSITMDSVFALGAQNIPMQFRLRRGGEWLVGGAQQWCSLDELNTYTGSSTLNPEKIDEYQLEWQWPFEGDNTADTHLALAATAANADFTLTITTTAEAAASAPAINGDGELLVQPRFTPRALALLALDLAVLAALLLLLLWRRRVYLCGFAPAEAGNQLACGRKKYTILPGGGFVLPRLYTGKHTFTLPGSSLKWRLKRSGNVQGVQFGANNTVLVGRTVRAVELYLVQTAAGLGLDTTRWAAIDSKNNVYTPAGVQPPDANGCSATPGGLAADQHKKYTFAPQNAAEKL